MRKRSSLIFTICFVTLFSICLLFDITVFAGTSGYYTYTVSSGNATITDVSSSLKKSVTIPETLDGYPVTGIGVGAFSNAYQMTSVTIPKSVKSIDSSAFTSCYNLTSISVDANNQFFSSFGGVLFDKNKTKLLRCPPGKYLSTYEVPESVTTIGDDAFLRCTHIYEVVLSDNVVSIGEFAFSDCIYLDNIFISNKLKTIGYHAFGVLFEEEAKRPLTVYYQGSKHEMLEINIDEGNEFLLKRNWFYNQCEINSKHSFSDINDKSCDVCNYVKVDWCHSYTINDNHTCDICGYSKAPSAPIVEKITNSSVTLKVCSYLEYSKDGVNWQDENVFEGLSSETEYIFYQRVKPTDDAVSESSLGTELTTKKLFYINFDANGGTDAPETQEKVEDIPMTISSQTPTRSGYIFAGWGSLKKCGKQYASGEEYTIDEDLTLYALWYAFDECDTCLGVGTIEKCDLCSGRGYYYNKMCLVCGSYATTIQKEQQHTLFFKCNVCDAECATRAIKCQWCDGTGKYLHDCGNCGGIGGNIIKQDAPVIVSYTDTTVTLMSKDGYEYSNDGVNWQESNVFTNLSSGIKYTFYKRVGATDTSCFSAMSEGASVTTDKSKQTLIPPAPTIQSFTSNSITLNAIDSYEYSKNGTTWQSSNVFSNLSCGTEYTFYQRYKENSTTYAGKSSKALVAKTDKGTQTKPSAPTLASKFYNSVTLTAISGYEYSKDGVNWQTSNVFTGLNAETNYMFFQRKAETTTHYASEASTSLTVKTAEEPICVSIPELHKYDDSCDESCNTCGSIRTITHNWKAATCKEPKTCSVCGTTSGSKLSHKSDTGTVTKSATCATTGTKTYKCTLCKVTLKTETIAKSTAHTFSNNCDKSCNVCGGTRTVGAHKYSNNADTSCDYCGAFAYPGGNVLYKDKDGKYYHVVNRKKVTDTLLMKHTNGKWYFVNKGVVDTTKTGLVKHTDGKYYHIVNGVKTTSTLLVKHTNGKWYYVEGGKVNTAKTGLVKHTDGKYYHVSNGVKTSSTLLVKHTNGKWYYVEGGKVNTAKTGLVKHTDGKYYHVSNGVKTSSTLLVKHTNGKWYYVEGGKVNTAKTGLVKHTDGKYYHVVNGVKTSSTILVKHTNGKYYNVKKGVVV